MSPTGYKKKKKGSGFHKGSSSGQGVPAQLPETSIADENGASAGIGENTAQAGKSSRKLNQVHDSSSIDVTLGSKGTVSADATDLVGKHSVLSDEEQAQSKHARKVLDEMAHPESVKETKGDWASLFKNNRNNSQGIKLEKLDGDLGSEVVIDDDDMQDVAKSLGSTLIGYVAGKSMGKLAIVQCCNKWKGKEQVIFHRSGWVIIRFASEEDRDRVMEEGPYSVFGRPFLLKPIPELFDFSDCEIRQVPVWVQFPNLPLELWTGKTLSKIGSRIGTPLNTDKLTRTMDRVCYARVLIEVDVANDLPTSISLRCPKGNTLTQEVYYEYLPFYCKECKVLGHSEDGCPRYNNLPKGQKREEKGKAKKGEEQVATTNTRGDQISNKENNLAQGGTSTETGYKTGTVAAAVKATKGGFTVVARNKQKKQAAGKQKAAMRESSSSGSSDSDETESLEVGYYAESNRSRYKPRKGNAGTVQLPKPMARKMLRKNLLKTATISDHSITLLENFNHDLHRSD